MSAPSLQGGSTKGKRRLGLGGNPAPGSRGLSMAVDGDEAYPVEMRLATCLLKEQTYLTTALEIRSQLF